MDIKISKKLDEFFNNFKHQVYKKGEILIRADDDPSGIFYLKKGIVRQYSISRDGEEQTLNLYKPFAFFPLMWAINNTPNTYYFEAVSDVEVYKAPKEETIEFVKGDLEIMYDIISRLYRGMHGILNRIEYLQSGDAHTKVIFALLNASYRFGEKKENSKVEISITHREISSLTGLTKETISRESAKLEKKELIINTNHLLTLNR